LVGYFNAKLGREDIFKPTIENQSLHQVGDDNGVRILNFVTSRILVVKSMMFPHRNIHECTWTEPNCCFFPVVVISHICCTHILAMSYQSTKLSILGVQAGMQPTLFSLWVTFWPTIQVKTALIPTFCKPSLLISCLETYHVRTGAWLSTFWTAPHFSLVWPSDTSNFQADPYVWTAITLGGHRPVCVTLDTQLMWVTHVHHIGQKAVQRLGLLSTVL